LAVPRLLHHVLLLFALSGLPGLAPAVPATGSASDRPIVSGSLASDEILVALFPDAGSADIVLSHFADDPAHSSIVDTARRFPRRWHNSPEALLALSPRVVILASFNNPALKARLAQAKVNTVELRHFNTLDDIRSNIRTVGKVVGREKEAEALVNTMNIRLQQVAARSSPGKQRPKILAYSASANPGGRGTLIDEIIVAAGGTNLAAEAGITGWARASAEILAGLQPDFVLVAVGAGPEKDTVAAMKRDPLWRHMRAVQDDRFIFAKQAYLFSVSHHIVSAVEAAGRALP
jgi:iron complex transport system substrate-binding protein